MTPLHALHAPGRLLILPNAWDALSARLIEDAGAEAIATSSAAVSWAHGYPDGERLPLEDLLRSAANIARCVRAPLTVDLERGFAGSPEGVADVVARFVDVGAVGVNLEDGGRPAEALASDIAAVRRRVSTRVFVNARTCLVLRGLVSADQTVDEVMARARVLREAGADGLFVPRLTEPNAIRAIASGTPLPLNVMVAPGLPPPHDLRALGVRRLSAGATLATAAYSHAAIVAKLALHGDSYDPLLASSLSYAQVDGLFSEPSRRSSTTGS